MRGLTRFERNERVTISGVDYVFHALIPPRTPRADGSDDLQFLEVRSRRAENFTPNEFLAAYGVGQVILHRVSHVPGDGVGDDENSTKQLRRRWRHFWTKTFDENPVKKSTSKLEVFIDAHKDNQPDPVDPPSPHTLRTWLRMRGQPGDRRRRQMGDRSRQAARKDLHPSVLAAWQTASDDYWTNYRTTFQAMQLQVRDTLFRENRQRAEQGKKQLKIPDRSTLYRWLMKERTPHNIRLREGRHVADRLFEPIRGSLTAKRLLDTAVIDHKRMDVHVVDAKTGVIVGRPWLAALVDVKSRMVIGHTLSFEDPSVLSLMACVRAALTGRPNLKAKYASIEGEWEAFGVPRTILADNAWENTGSSFVDACSDFGISIEWAPVRTPGYKGILERLFSRLDDQCVHLLPGGVTDKPHKLAEAGIDPRVDATLTLDQLDEFVSRYFVDVYAWDWHDGIDAAPLKVWRDAAPRDGIELANNLADVAHAMGTLVRDRTLSREGVIFNGLTFRSMAVGPLLADLLCLQPARVRRGTAKVKIKYHPEDLSRIFVWNEARRCYVELPCTLEIYSQGLSERIHNEIQQQIVGADRQFISEEDRCQKKAAFIAATQAAYPSRSMAERRRLARLLASTDEAAKSTEAATTTKVDAMSTRSGGDRPEKSAVRANRRKKPPRTPPQPIQTISATGVVDPFANRDRKAAIDASTRRLK